MEGLRLAARLKLHIHAPVQLNPAACTNLQATHACNCRILRHSTLHVHLYGQQCSFVKEFPVSVCASTASHLGHWPEHQPASRKAPSCLGRALGSRWRTSAHGSAQPRACCPTAAGTPATRRCCRHCRRRPATWWPCYRQRPACPPKSFAEPEQACRCGKWISSGLP